MIDKLTLTPEDELIIQDWAEALKPVLEKHPILSKVDLIIEGGVGTGSALSTIISRLFPGVLYIGTDLTPSLNTSKPRLKESIDDQSLDSVLIANQVDFDIEKASIFANCFDIKLINSIMEKSGKSFPMLASFNGLFALTDRKNNQMDSKSLDDIYPLEHILFKTPYVAQLHISAGLYAWDEFQSAPIRPYTQLESLALGNEIVTERLDCGLLIVKSVK